ncbi:MAG TPA: VOC family protein [Terriglobales bacterium]|nr:VOC family protein [Terriglobales bacterium]
MLRRLVFRWLGLAWLFFAAFQASLAGQVGSASGHVLQVGPVAMTVSDMDRSVMFYTGVLTFEKVSDTERGGPQFDHLYGVSRAHLRVVDLKLGDESIELMQFLGATGAPVPADARSNDLSFQHVAIIVSDMTRAYEVLRQNQVQSISSYPQTLPEWNPNAAGIKAFYFQDPDGHPLEVLQFPSGKGDPKWQQSSGRLFLGIDHTAIAVSNTDASLAFYGALLGMRVAGESDNYGFEQEHLNNVFGAHLRITALRSPSGIGVEFLNYLTPRGGRPAAANASPTDIDHHETVIVVDDLAGLDAQLQAHNCSGVSVKQIADSGLLFNASQAELVRDPDGHFLLLLQR